MDVNEQALDHWVSTALAEAYSPVADERLPEEWLTLVQDAVWD